LLKIYKSLITQFSQTYQSFALWRTDAFSFSAVIAFALAVEFALLVLAAICKQIVDDWKPTSSCGGFTWV